MRRLLVACGLMLAMVATVLSLSGSPANAWGVRSHCDGHTILTHTQTTDPFAGHHMDVYLHGCATIGTATVGPHIIWTQRPRVSFRSSNPIGGAIESVKISTPVYFYDASKCSSTSKYYCQVRYRWSVHQCVNGSLGTLCNDWTFGVKYRLVGTQICMVGGANTCSGWKHW